MLPPEVCPACSAALPLGEPICPTCGLVLASRPAQPIASVPPFQPPSPSPPAQPPAVPAVGLGLPALPSLLPGQRLADGRYTLGQPLSKGGMGQLFLATDHQAFDRTVVVKALHQYFDPADAAAAHEAQEQFLSEARTLAALRHPGIPQIYGYFQDSGRNLIVMEYIEGHDLDGQLSHHDLHSGAVVLGQPFPPDEVLRWGIALCKMLEYLAARRPPVVHNDIKPANLILDRNSDTIRLVDFGTARARPQQGAGAKGAGYGTPGYAAPEQYRGESEPRSDVYALAATLYHLLTDDDPSAHPFSFPRLARLGAFGAALRPALEVELARRPSAAQLRVQLEALRGDEWAMSIEAPDGRELATPVALAGWVARNWDAALPWLVGRLPDQIEVRWGRSALAGEIRALIGRHPDQPDLALDGALRLLDPALPQSGVAVDPLAVSFGRVSLRDSARRLIRLVPRGAGALALTVQAPPWLSVSPQSVTLRPGRPVDLAVALRWVPVSGAVLSNQLAISTQHGPLLQIPVSAELFAQSPDGQALPDLAALAAWCEANRERAHHWLTAPDPDSIPGLVEQFFAAQPLAQQLRILARRHDQATHAERELILDEALALIDPAGFGTAAPQVVDLPPGLVLWPLALRRPQTVEIRNSGRRAILLQPQAPPWLKLYPLGQRALLPGEALRYEATLVRQQLPVRRRPQSEIRLSEAGVGVAALALPVRIALLPGPARAALRAPFHSALVALLALALLWWLPTVGERELNRAGHIRAAEAALQQNDLATARRELQAAQTRRDSPDVEAQLQQIAATLGAAALGRGDYATAQRELSQAGTSAEVQAQLRESYYQPAVTAIRERRWQEAAQQIAALEGYEPAYRDLADLINAHPDLARPLFVARWGSGRIGRSITLSDSSWSQLLGLSANELLALQYGGLVRVALDSGVQTGTTNLPVNAVSWQPIAADPTFRSVAFFKNGWLALSGLDGNDLTDLPYSEGVRSATFSPNGELLAGFFDNQVVFWRTADRTVLGTVPWANNTYFTIAFSPDGQFAALSRNNNLIYVRTADGEVVHSTRIEGLEVLAFSPDGQTLVTQGFNSELLFIDAASGAMLRTQAIDAQFPIYRLANIQYSPDGRWMALVSYQGVLLIPSSGAGSTAYMAEGTTVAFSPDSQIVAVATFDGSEASLLLYSLDDGRLLQELPMPRRSPDDYYAQATLLRFSPDGSALVSQSVEGVIAVWRPLTWQTLADQRVAEQRSQSR